MSKIVLPPWIEGTARAILTDFVNGMKPRELLAKHSISHSTLANLRYQYHIPSQVQLRAKGILAPTRTGYKGKTQTSTSSADSLVLRRRGNGRTAEQRRQLIEDVAQQFMAKNGKISLTALAKQHKVTPKAVSDRVKELGGSPRRGPILKNMPSDRNKKLVDKVINEGLTYEEASLEFGITRQRVEQIVKRSGRKISERPPEALARLKERRAARSYHHPKEADIVAELRMDQIPPSDIAAKYKIDKAYLQKLRIEYKIPRSNRLNWRTEEQIAKEQAAIDAYYNRSDLTTAWISENILKVNNPGGVVQLLQRRGLERTRGKEALGENYRAPTGPRRQYTKEQITAALKDYQNPDLTLDDILVKHNMSNATLIRWRKIHNVPKTPHRLSQKDKRRTRHGIGAISDLSPVKFDQAIRDGRAAGKTRTDISKELGISLGRVIKRAKALGIEFPIVNRIAEGKVLTLEEQGKIDTLLRQARKDGVSISELARTTEYSNGRLQRRAKKLDLQFPRGNQTAKSQSARVKTRYPESSNLERIARDMEVVADYRSGMAVREIVTKHKIVNSQLYSILAKYNVERMRRPLGLTARPGPLGGRLPASERKAILDKYEQGVARSTIFAEHPVLENNSSRLDYLVRKAGIKRPKGHKQVSGQMKTYSEKQRELILRFYRPGKTRLPELANRVGLTVAIIRNLLIKEGVYKSAPPGNFVGRKQKRR